LHRADLSSRELPLALQAVSHRDFLRGQPSPGLDRQLPVDTVQHVHPCRYRRHSIMLSEA
jgi:hypothetical protein